jgi:exocyst complex component 4
LQAVLEKQSYILLSRNDVENLMRLEPANISLQNSSSELDNSVTDAEAVEVETELSDLLLDMCLIKQVMTFTNLTFFCLFFIFD